MSAALSEVANVVQRPGELRRRWFASEPLDLLVWVDADDAPIGFQLGWRDGGKSHALTLQPGEPLRHELVDDGERGGAGYSRAATLHTALEDYDLALIQPRFAAACNKIPAALSTYVLAHLGTPTIEPTSAGNARPLEGWVVLVTRPLRQAKPLLALLDAAGAQARLLPMIAIRPAPDRAMLTSQLNAYRAASAWLFTSANAVSAASGLLAVDHWEAPVFAVGDSTAAALRSLGLKPQRPPADAMHAEGLLSLPALQGAAGKSVLILTGESGRDGLQEALLARGAHVEVATLYRRQVVPHLPDTVELTLDGVDALLLTSGESLAALHRVLPAAQKAALLRLPMVAPSSRVVSMAKVLGFKTPVLAQGTSDKALMQALIDWRAANSD